MGINLINRIIAETRLAGVHGERLAGGYCIGLKIEFSVLNWDDATAPDVLFAPARIYIVEGQARLLLGMAFPETIQPFTVGKHAARRECVFSLPLTQQAMEAVERRRDGGDVLLAVKLDAEVRTGADSQAVHDLVQGQLNVAQWIAALEQAGYGRSILFEIPIPANEELGATLNQLETARQLLVQGHYADAVAKCRVVVEGITHQLGQRDALVTARQLQKQSRTLEQRELVMRQAAMDFASVAHHADGASAKEDFSRSAAQMMLSITSALVASAVSRGVRGER